MPQYTDGMTEAEIQEKQREAYEMGYESGRELSEAELAEMGGPYQSADEALQVSIDHLSETAAWANHTAPALRKMAGYSDPTGVGTYTGIESGDPFLFDRLVEEYREGRYDKAKGHPKGRGARSVPVETEE